MLWRVKQLEDHPVYLRGIYNYVGGGRAVAGDKLDITETIACAVATLPSQHKQWLRHPFSLCHPEIVKPLTHNKQEHCEKTAYM